MMTLGIESHKRIVEFVEKNYEEILDMGLMDDVLFEEYKTGVDKLYHSGLLSEEKTRLVSWLELIVNMMANCAIDNIAAGRTYSIYKNFLECAQSAA